MPELTSIAEIDGQPVGAGFGLLDFNQIIKQINGRLFPLGWWKLLRGKRKIDRLRLISTNVLPEYQKWGLGLVTLARILPDAVDVWNSRSASSLGCWKVIRFRGGPLNGAEPNRPKSIESTTVHWLIFKSPAFALMIRACSSTPTRIILSASFWIFYLASSPFFHVPMPRSNVVITGLGVVSSIGIGSEVFFQALLDKRSGIKSLSEPTDEGAKPGACIGTCGSLDRWPDH